MPSESKEDEDKPKSRLRPKVVLLNASKREAFAPNSGFKRLFGDSDRAIINQSIIETILRRSCWRMPMFWSRPALSREVHG